MRRKAFVSEYAALTVAAQRTGARIFFADEAHFQADADLRGKWVLKGEPALVDSTSPRRGEKASYYSAVCLETGDVEVMELEGNSNAATSAAFLQQLRARHTEPLTMIWDNSPAHRGDAIRAYLATPGLNLRLVNPVSSTGQALPSYSPDFNADEAIWGWAREEAPPTGAWGPVPRCRRRWTTFHRSGPPTRRSQAAMPDHPSGSRSGTDSHRPSPSFRPGKCRFHLGFGLVLGWWRLGGRRWCRRRLHWRLGAWRRQGPVDR